ncbi:MAG: FtsW/RodA/SpoVE family cell cycle protein [Fusobacterium sp.]|uniref:FtsW/RodA/SpoVE family cell cycle protein n=1 Tax=Fusobacterium sp. TaxID=68766 RepID=UPI002942860B|nr:FtsW/RodA/SpoVE family cell cycle protein [Fusobacterium sp.]MDY3058609.1 FtsW/RodA/SpoVE family cell cycle protein [Fusobacterium sp.]MEE1476787.1 FtsW/RodA/SpoVE family cell cycle protein [Fusobacterium sp.]
MATNENINNDINEKIKTEVKEEKNLYYKINRINKDKLNYENNKRRKRRNLTFIVCIMLLIILAVVNMFSANFYMIYSKGLKYFKSYLVYIGISLGCFVVGGFVNYKIYNRKRICSLIALISIAILAFVWIAAGTLPKVVPNIKGAYGWIKIGTFTLQPAEFLKLPFIILLAHLFERVEKEKYRNIKVILYVILIPLIFGIFICAQGDLGTTLHYMAILLFMLFLAQIDMKIIIGVTTIGFIGAGAAFYWIYNFMDMTTAHFRYRRIISFITGLLTNEYDNAIGYQVWQSLIAFGSGGVIGKGYANGVQKYKYLPEVSTDFILASYGEELGLIGMVILMALLLTIFNLITKVAIEEKDYFGKYLVMGIGGYIITQVLINIYVALGMLPVFGIPMPIFSYGGSSLVTIFTSLGIILNVNNNKNIGNLTSKYKILRYLGY